MGDDTPLPVDPDKPNILTFRSVSEKDLGHYRCVVKEAGIVVLTLYRTLCRDESNTTFEDVQSDVKRSLTGAVQTVRSLLCTHLHSNNFLCTFSVQCLCLIVCDICFQ